LVTRTNDPERTKADILAMATHEFSENGFSGGRIDEIAERTKTSKRMIYYYFGSKDGLYRAVLTEYYRKLRSQEQDLHLEDLSPLEGMKRLVHFTVDYHIKNAEDVRLVMVENIHRGRHIQELPALETLNSSLVDLIGRICKRGVAEGVIRRGLDPMDVYMSIAALSYFNVSNRYTFSTIFGVDMGSKAFLSARKRSITDTILRSVAADPAKL
jgi:AcrR family transcriptional regulator